MKEATLPDKESFAQKANLWVQTLGIIVAGVWAVNTFWYKEVKVPATVPVNLVLALDLKVPIFSKKNRSPLIPVEVHVSARNPSTRNVYLLPSIFVAYGTRVTPKDGKLPPEMTIGQTSNMTFWDAHATTAARELFATGRLFVDTSLGAGEAVSHQDVVFAKAGSYDVLDFQIQVPSVTKPDALDLSWLVTQDSELHPILHKITKGQQGMDISPDNVEEAFKRSLELQFSSSVAQIAVGN
jgi:hypothetical protein